MKKQEMDERDRSSLGSGQAILEAARRELESGERWTASTFRDEGHHTPAAFHHLGSKFGMISVPKGKRNNDGHVLGTLRHRFSLSRPRSLGKEDDKECLR